MGACWAFQGEFPVWNRVETGGAVGTATAFDLLQMTPVANATRNLVIALLKSESAQRSIISSHNKTYDLLPAATIVRLLHDKSIEII